jgi:hypothetical protein
VKLKTPITAGLKAVPPASLSILNGVPGINYRDNTVTFEAFTYREARRGIGALRRVAGEAYFRVLLETVEKKDNAQKIWEEHSYDLFMRWLDYESSRWKPPE